MMEAAVLDVDRLWVFGGCSVDEADEVDGEWLTSAVAPYRPLMVYTLGKAGTAGWTAGRPPHAPSSPASLLTMLEVVMTESGRWRPPADGCEPRSTVSCS
jgi:hypothetical protein